MPNLDISSWMLCLQALDTAIRYHEEFAKSETVDPADDAELIFAYETKSNAWENCTRPNKRTGPIALR